MYYSALDAKGLMTFTNLVGAQIPPGAVSVAMNVNGDVGNNGTGAYTTRRGFSFYSNYQFPVDQGYIKKLFVYSNRLLAYYGSGQLAYDDGAGNWNPFIVLGIVDVNFSMQPPPGGFVHQMLAGGNSYFTTSNGMYKLSGLNTAAPVPAGAPAALDTTCAVSGMISSGFLNAQSQCAYSCVWGYTDEENLLILGAPSQPQFAANTQSAGANNNANVTLTISIPPQIIAQKQLPWFVQIYRTPNTGSLLVPPGNNYQLVASYSPNSTDYTNCIVTYADTLNDAYLGADLYTDNGQPGAGQPYGQPPLAQDAAYFNSMAFYANYSTMQNVLLTLDAVGGGSGLQSGDTITIKDSTAGSFPFGGSYTYTGGGSNNPATRTFAVYTGGSASVNIATTAQNLVSVINQDPNNLLFTVQYLSGYAGLPGQMQLYAQNLSQAFFSITSSRTTCWTPTVPSSGVTYASANVTQQNGLFISGVSMPESVPPANIEPIGSPNYPIARIIPVRTGLIVVKPEEGVWIGTGTSPQTMTFTSLDTTAFIKGSETMVALNNSGYFFTTQGVMLVNESGCEIMSRSIQGDLLSLASYNYSNFSNLAFSVGYQSDNAFILFLQQNSTDTYSTLQYRYNWITQAWTNWDLNVTAAVVNTADDRLYMATPEGYIIQERKTFTSNDYADESFTVTITGTTSTTITLSSSINTNVGDQISQTNGMTTYTALVTANNTITGVLNVADATGFQAGAASDLAAISSTVTYLPTTANYPAFVKKASVWEFVFGNISFDTVSASFSTDFFASQESVTLTPKLSNQWGAFPWGTVPWGLGLPTIAPITTYATKNTSIAHWFIPTIKLQQVFCGFNLSGYGVFFEFLGSRSR